MKKVVFILVAMMALCSAGCSQSIISPCEYMYGDFSEENAKNSKARNLAIDQFIEHIRATDTHDCRGKKFCEICYNQKMTYDSIYNSYDVKDTSFSAPQYDVTDLLDEFCIDKEQFKKLQDHYGAEHIQLDIRVCDNFSQYVSLPSGGWYTKVVKIAEVWIWYGNTEYDYGYDFNHERKILLQKYEWNEFEMTWKLVSK